MKIAVHGGAGTILPEQLTPELEKNYRAGLERALKSGYEILKNGGSSLDAVQAAVTVLEDDPLFNAGRGAVLTHEGKCEMDAAIMDGATRRAGAVAGIHGIKNPVVLARMVMEKSEHVMLVGKGAEDFARANKLIFKNEEYFLTEQRRQQWLSVKDTDTTLLDHTNKKDEKKFGTVGAVAIDSKGNLAASTSTGGMTNKRWGRVGDTPLIGAGTFADETVAISCTGHGEFYIRRVVAHEISALMRYKNVTLQEACDEVVFNQLQKDGGEGGLIAIDSKGNCTLSFNTPGMYRGTMDAEGNCTTAIYK
ncbi:MAG: isoaspartyl peptidase/L-asparaginase [Bacteroidetes bacterium]|nr:isoaspartyl peptidase/L-asparaginase [Bacteroidota bacterium]